VDGTRKAQFGQMQDEVPFDDNLKVKNACINLSFTVSGRPLNGRVCLVISKDDAFQQIGRGIATGLKHGRAIWQ